MRGFAAKSDLAGGQRGTPGNVSNFGRISGKPIHARKADLIRHLETVDSPEDEAKLSARMGSHVRSPVGWKNLYQSALLEPEPAKMMGRIADARTAILDRMAELKTCPSCDEVRALNDALRFLHILQKEIQTADQSK